MGCAFEFDDNYENSIMTYLRGRESNDFQLLKLDVGLESARIVQAVTPVKRQNHSSYIGNLTVEARAANARFAVGNGNCVDYIDNIYRYLRQLGIDDAKVNAMWEAIH